MLGGYYINDNNILLFRVQKKMTTYTKNYVNTKAISFKSSTIGG